MTQYRIFPSTNGPGAPVATSGPWLLGVLFSVTGRMMWLNGYYHWIPTGGDTVPHKFALWNQYGLTSNRTLVPNSTVTSGTLTANAWNFVPLPAPIQLAPGTLYCAAVGWTATNGIPNTVNQWGAAEPLAAGIVNGPLTAWSSLSGTNQFPAASQNQGFGQGLFSNVLGADPSVAMPDNGSGDDNFWVDVQVDDTPPAAYAGSYRFYPNMTDLGAYSLDTANNFTLGRQFRPSGPVAVNNVWFYSPATVTQLPTAIGVFRVSDQALVLVNNAPSWSGAVASGWVSAPLSGNLPGGTDYKVAVLNGAGTPAIWNAAVANYWSTGFGVNGLIAGPLSAPNNANAAPPGQDTYNPGATMTYPTTNVGPFNYGLDIEVTALASSSAPPGGDYDRSSLRKELIW